MPIVSVVKSLRNALVLVLRKALFTRFTEVKQIELFSVLLMYRIFFLPRYVGYP